jgi:Vps53-like, N-terminal
MQLSSMCYSMQCDVGQCSRCMVPLRQLACAHRLICGLISHALIVQVIALTLMHVATTITAAADAGRYNRRFAWFRRLLRSIDLRFEGVFPSHWRLQQRLCLAFMDKTRASLLEVCYIVQYTLCRYAYCKCFY